jgi:glucokinase
MDVIGAVDVGGTKIAVGLVTRQGQVVAHQVLPTQPETSFSAGIDVISRVLQRLCSQKSASLPLKPLGIGVACTGQVDPLEGVVLKNGFLPNWTAQNPVRWLSEQFGVQVALENDADAAALAEWHLGAGRGSERFIYLTISTGIGGGLVFSGQLVRGAKGAHPEVGHHTIDPAGPLCFCGNRGCWEMFASGRALQARFLALQPGFDGDARHICDLAEAGDSQALRAVADHAEMLGVGLANLITLFAPDRIVLGGGLMRRANLFLPVVHQVISQRCTLVPPEIARLELSQFPTDSSLIGAAMAWVHRYFE